MCSNQKKGWTNHVEPGCLTSCLISRVFAIRRYFARSWRQPDSMSNWNDITAARKLNTVVSMVDAFIFSTIILHVIRVCVEQVSLKTSSGDPTKNVPRKTFNVPSASEQTA